MLTTEHATPIDVLEFVVLPGDPDWDAVRQTFNVLHDQRPEAIALSTRRV